MFDIKELLFPQLLTVLVQLAATGVLFFLYAKYLHQPVLKILDKKAESYQEATNELERVKKEQQEELENFKLQKQQQIQELELSKKYMIDEIERKKDIILKEAKDEAMRIHEKAESDIVFQRQQMYKDLEHDIVDIANSMVEKVLEGYTFNQTEIMNALEKELVKHAQS